MVEIKKIEVAMKQVQLHKEALAETAKRVQASIQALLAEAPGTNLYAELRHLRELEAETQANLNSACDTVIQACRWELTSNMVAKLPRELLDLIYDYILENRSTDPANHFVLVNSTSFWILEQNCTDSLQSGSKTTAACTMPPFALYGHVHEMYRVELAETLYRTKMLRVVDPTELKAVLNYDLLKTSCEPKDHIRHIEIELKLNYCTLSRVHYVKAVEPLYYLRHIKHLNGLRVGFIVEFKYDATVLLVEEVTAPLVQYLVSRGVKVNWYKKAFRGFPHTQLVLPARDFDSSLRAPEDETKVKSPFGP